MINCDEFFSSCSIVGRVKDTFKTPAGCRVSPYPIEDVLLAEPQGLVADALVAGVTPDLRSEGEKGMVPRAWIVLSDGGKKVGADGAIKELEAWYQKKLSKDKWLLGGIQIVDEVCMALVFNIGHFMIQILNLDSQVSFGKAIKSSIAEKL